MKFAQTRYDRNTIVTNNYFISNTLSSSKTTLTMTLSGIANSYININTT